MHSFLVPALLFEAGHPEDQTMEQAYRRYVRIRLSSLVLFVTMTFCTTCSAVDTPKPCRQNDALPNVPTFSDLLYFFSKLPALFLMIPFMSDRVPKRV